jgi:hypothetical protein
LRFDFGEADERADRVRATPLAASGKVGSLLWEQILLELQGKTSFYKRQVAERHRISTTVRAGDSVSSNNSAKSGSLTCLVTFASHPSSVYALTCAHVLDLSDTRAAIMSPSYKYGSMVLAFQGRDGLKASDYASFTLGSITTYCLGVSWHGVEQAAPLDTPLKCLPTEHETIRPTSTPAGACGSILSADWALIAVDGRTGAVGPDWRKVAQKQPIKIRGLRPGESVVKLPSLITKIRVRGLVSAVPAAIQYLGAAERLFAFCVVSANQCSRQGDSGAPVVDTREGALVAVVTAGSSPSRDITILQDASVIEQQLRERGFKACRS